MIVLTSCKWILLAPFAFLSFLLIGAEETCEAGGVCGSIEGQRICETRVSHCRPSSSSLYRNGGTAQAYKTDSPEKENVCEPAKYSATSYKTASWAFRRTSSKPAPTLKVKAHVWSCQDDIEASNCCCELMEDPFKVEVWQTRPDGSYASLQKRKDDGDCRATILSNGTFFGFETVAPGSTGILGGLGPSGRDYMPYGPPVIHFLISSDNHRLTLLDVPLLIDRHSLNYSYFNWPDLRGSAWVRGKVIDEAYQISEWKPETKSNQVIVELIIFLPKRDSFVEDASLCQADITGLPISFFLEPIAECTPSVLDFFEL
jgi:hypothetical protein